MAVIAGADGPEAIGTWADSNHTWLKKHLQLPHGNPSHDTLGRLHRAALKPISLQACFQVCFQACFQAWIQTVAPLNNDGAMNQIAIDGKVLRVSHDRSISLGQLARNEKSKEITAIPQRLDNMKIKGAVVTIDAAGCQREIAKKIIAIRGWHPLSRADGTNLAPQGGFN